MPIAPIPATSLASQALCEMRDARPISQSTCTARLPGANIPKSTMKCVMTVSERKTSKHLPGISDVHARHCPPSLLLNLIVQLSAYCVGGLRVSENLVVH